MEYDINDLDWEEDLEDIDESSQENLNLEVDKEENTSNANDLNLNDFNDTDKNSSEEEDLITFMLKSKGINDPSKIKFESDEGTIEELDWNNLSREELINILTQREDVPDENSLDDDEIDLINSVRNSKLTPKEYELYLISKGALQYKNMLEESSTTYQINDLSDDELYVLDLQARVEDITDDEALELLKQAKNNPDLFQKQIKGIRDEYIRLEKDNNESLKAQQQEAQNELFKQFANQIKHSIKNLNQIGDLSIELDDDDMETLGQFLLTSDAAGINYFSKALNNPDNLVKTAWFLLKGEEAFNLLQNSFNSLLEASKKELQKNKKDDKIKFVYQPKNNNNINIKNQKLFTIDDLD